MVPYEERNRAACGETGPDESCAGKDLREAGRRIEISTMTCRGAPNKSEGYSHDEHCSAESKNAFKPNDSLWDRLSVPVWDLQEGTAILTNGSIEYLVSSFSSITN